MENFENIEPIKGSKIRTYVSNTAFAKKTDLVKQLYAAEETSIEKSTDTEDHTFQGMTTKGYVPTVSDWSASFDIVNTKSDAALALIVNAEENGLPLYFAWFNDIDTFIGKQCKVIVTKLSDKLEVGGTITTSVEFKPALGAQPTKIDLSTAV